jgi:hypothetical protein
MESSIISVVSASVAVAALAVATWQVRANARSAERSHTLPVISDIFREFRSQEFRNSMSHLVMKMPKLHGEDGFSSLSREWQEHAYRVCYFFDYLGTLVSFGIIQGELAISICGTWAMRVWLSMEPFIENERHYRNRVYPRGTPSRFPCILRGLHLQDDRTRRRRCAKTHSTAIKPSSSGGFTKPHANHLVTYHSKSISS